MKRVSVSAAIVLAVVCLSSVAFTQTSDVPRVIRYNGTLINPDGSPRAGTFGISFSIYADERRPVPLWQEVQSVTTDVYGHYTVLLGTARSEGVPAALFMTNDARWLGIRVEDEPEQSRILLAAVPYALKAADAETFGGKPLSAFVLNENVTREGTEGTAAGQGTAAGPVRIQPLSINASSTGTQNFLAMWTDGAGTLGDSALSQLGSNIGVGNTNPTAPLQVGPDFTLSGAWPTMGYNLYYNGGWKYATSGSGTLMQQDYANNGLRIAVAPSGSASAPATLSDVMFVASTGNVGLGTTSPHAPMQVGPDLTFSGAWPTMGLNLYYSGGWKYATTNGGSLIQQDYANNGLNISVVPTGTAGAAAALASAVFVGGNGKVGFGTVSPAEKLDVNGNILGHGTVTATSFAGNGANLTNLSASNISTGTLGVASGGTGLTSSGLSGRFLRSNGTAWTSAAIASGDLPANVALLDAASPTFTNGVTAASFTGSGTGLSNVNAAAVGSIGSGILKTHLITYISGCDSCSALTTADNQNLIYQNLLGADLTLLSITCYSDNGSPSIDIERAGIGNVTSSSIPCSTSPTAVTTFSQGSLPVDGKLNFKMTTPGLISHRVTVIIKTTL